MTSPSSQPQTIVRCPACGEPLEENAERCSLCRYDLGVERATTSEDTTPFAEAAARGETCHRAMWKWIWLAPAGRLKHLALTRSSSESGSFFLVYLVLLAMGLGVVQGTHHGWRAVTATPALEPTGSIKPQGRGWLRAAGVPQRFRVTQPLAAPVDLWWNAAQAVIAGVAGFVAGLVTLWVLYVLVRVGMERSHKRRYRGEGRMTAALHYSMAWSVPLLLSALLLSLTPLSRVGGMARWSWHPSLHALGLIAGIVAAVTLVAWWFWLLRLGSTAPADTRGRVEAFLGIQVPLLAAAAGAAWWFGLNYGLTALFHSWKLQF